MQHRRLITTPLLVLLAIALIAAVIDSGQRSQANTQNTIETKHADNGLLREQALIDDLIRTASYCQGSLECSSMKQGENMRKAAETISSWPLNPQFTQSRRALYQMLIAKSAVLDQSAMSAIDGQTSLDERDRLDELKHAWSDTALADVDARFAAGLIDRTERTRARLEIARSKS